MMEPPTAAPGGLIDNGDEGKRVSVEEVHHSHPSPESLSPPHPVSVDRRLGTLLCALAFLVLGLAAAVTLVGRLGKVAIFGPSSDSCWGGDCEWDCEPSRSLPSRNVHMGATEGAVVSRVAFSSCIKPELQISDALWS